MEAFPVPGVARDTLARWFREGGRPPDEPHALLALDGRGVDPGRQRLIALASFVETWLAKEGHGGAVGINLLTKIQMPNLPALWGAMLAGVDVVLMGAGIPREIPAILDELAEGRPARLRMEILERGEAAACEEWYRLDPSVLGPEAPRLLRRPAFVPIVASNLLANVLVRKATGRIDGLVVEAPVAGGHVAPPRDDRGVNDCGEPVYGERDEVDIGRIAALGLPFWLAGGTGWPDRLEAALAVGATGIQVGTLFAFCRESGLDESLKQQALELARRDDLGVLTDPRASPTGFPFKILGLPGTLSDPTLRSTRSRACDLGYLRLAYRKEDGSIGFRCPSEPVATHVARGGQAEDTVGRLCLCNALMANAGVAQVLPDGSRELPLVTAGDDAARLATFLGGRTDYGADDVLDHLLGSGIRPADR